MVTGCYYGSVAKLSPTLQSHGLHHIRLPCPDGVPSGVWYHQGFACFIDAIHPSHPFHDDWKWRESFSGYRRSNKGTLGFIRRKIILGAGTKSVWRFSEAMEAPLLFTEPLSILSQSWQWLGYHMILRLKRIMKGIKAKTSEPLYLTPPQPLQWGLIQGHPTFHQ